MIHNLNDTNPLLAQYSAATAAAARANIGAGSNPNLLDNWDFRNPVNQRGKTEYAEAAGAYTIDRWYISTSMSRPAIVDGGVRLTVSQDMPAQTFLFSQKIENPDRYRGLELTASLECGEANIGDGRRLYWGIRAATAEGTHIASNAVTPISNGICSTSLVIPDETEELAVVVTAQINTTDSIVLRRAKLEPGSVSTLANDPPMDYGAELEKCKRYLLTFGSGDIAGFGSTWNSTDAATAFFPVPVSMRTIPSLGGGASTAANWTVRIDGVLYTPSTIIINTAATSGIQVGTMFSFGSTVPKNTVCVAEYTPSDTAGLGLLSADL